MRLNIFIALLATLCLPSSLQAQRVHNDTTSLRPQIDAPAIAMGAILLGGGFWAHSSDHNYSKSQQSPFTGHSSTLDDIIRWTPTAFRMGLRLAGYEGKSSLKRLLIARIAGFGAVNVAVEGSKRIISQRRPDWESHKSTPSGHAALSFMSAAVLDEEYGHLSPFITLGAYTASSFISFDRVLGNHHYASDVAIGAGIGLLTTKISYLLTDIILKEKKASNTSPEGTFAFSDRPSYIGLFNGYAIPLRQLSLGGNDYRQQAGLSLGLQGACFLTDHFGLAARVAETRTLFSVNGNPSTTPLDRLSALAGITASTPAGRFRLGATLMAGHSWQTSHFQSLRHSSMVSPEGFSHALGIHADYPFKKNLGIRLQVDYEAVSATHTLNYLQPSAILHYAF